jgi:hypothetical protein
MFFQKNYGNECHGGKKFHYAYRNVFTNLY